MIILRKFQNETGKVLMKRERYRKDFSVKAHGFLKYHIIL